MEILGSNGVFIVGNAVAEAVDYRLYLCQQKDTGRQCLLQIALAAEFNGGLDRASFILNELTRRGDEVEAEYERVRTDTKQMLNYNLGFPELVDSFICLEQGGRRVNILAFRHVDNVSKMVPLSNITAKDQLRVDLKTSAWIMGKLLKLLVFAHSEGIAVGQVTGGNILIEPDQHYVLIFDWSNAVVFQDGVREDVRREEISSAAQAVISILGGDLETGSFPDDGEAEEFAEYTMHILQLAKGGERNSVRAHRDFYEMVDKLWGRKFHPFTCHKI